MAPWATPLMVRWSMPGSICWSKRSCDHVWGHHSTRSHVGLAYPLDPRHGFEILAASQERQEMKESHEEGAWTHQPAGRKSKGWWKSETGKNEGSTVRGLTRLMLFAAAASNKRVSCLAWPLYFSALDSRYVQMVRFVTLMASCLL